MLFSGDFVHSDRFLLIQMNIKYQLCCLAISILIFIFELIVMIDGVVQRCSVKKVSLEISQNSQENTCARVFGTGIFQWTLWNSTNIFSMEHLWWLLLYWSPPYHLLLVITLVLIKKTDNDYVMKHLFIPSLILGVIYISLVVTPRFFLCIGDRKSFEQCLTKPTMAVNDTHREKLFYSFQFKNLLK